MQIRIGNIVLFEFHKKTRIGVVIALDTIPGSAVVAIGYGIRNRHDDAIVVNPLSRDGRMLRIYKTTSFYAERTQIIPITHLRPTGRDCSKSLLRKLEPFVGEAIRNSIAEADQPERKKARTYSTKTFNITLGDLINNLDERYRSAIGEGGECSSER